MIVKTRELEWEIKAHIALTIIQYLKMATPFYDPEINGASYKTGVPFEISISGPEELNYGAHRLSLGTIKFVVEKALKTHHLELSSCSIFYFYNDRVFRQRDKKHYNRSGFTIIIHKLKEMPNGRSK